MLITANWGSCNRTESLFILFELIHLRERR